MQLFWHKKTAIIKRILNRLITNNEVEFILPSTNKPTNVNITIKSIVFIFLLQYKGLTQLIRQDKINIHSNIKTTQLLINLLKEVDIDFKEMMSKYTRDIITHQLAKLTKKIQKVNIQKINSLEMIKNRLSTLSINKIKTKRHKRKNSWTLCIAF